MIMNNKRIGISCKSESWLEEIEKINTEMFQHIELNIYNVDPGAKMFDTNYLDRVKDKLREKNLTVSIHTIGGTNFAEKINRIRRASVEILRDTLEMADYIGAEWVVVHVGNAGFSGNNLEKKKKRIELAACSFSEALELCPEVRTKIALENLYRYSAEQKKCKIGTEVEEFKWLFQYVNSDRVGMLYDMGHDHICHEFMDGEEHFLEAFRDKIIALHIHYNDGLEDYHYGLDQYDVSLYKRELDLIRKLNDSVCLVCESYSLEENIASREILHRYLQ